MRTSRAAAIATACVLVAALLTAAPATADAVRWSHLDGLDSGKLASGLSSSVAGSNIKRTGDLTTESWWGNDSSWNRYSYVLNNPVKLVDPNGENPQGVLQENAYQPSRLSPEMLNLKRKIDANIAGATVAATLAYFTAGQSLWANLLTGGVANILGGITTRGMDGDPETAPVDQGSIAVDFMAAGVGVYGTTRIFGSQAVKTGVDNALGAGASRFASEAFSNSVTPITAITIDNMLNAIPWEDSDPSTSDETVNCHRVSGTTDILRKEGGGFVFLVPSH